VGNAPRGSGKAAGVENARLAQQAGEGSEAQTFWICFWKPVVARDRVNGIL